MILTVTLNAALDVTYLVPEVVLHTSHRVTAVHERAGGKGINVASVLHRRGLEVLASGLVAGLSGGHVRRDLSRRGVPHAFLDVEGESRRTVSIVAAAGDATVFNESGPQVDRDGWRTYLEQLERLVSQRPVEVVVLSGSLPPGVPVDAYAQLVAAVRAHGARTVLDADGDVLLAALPAGPDIVKPNRQELTAATGIDDPRAGAAALQRRGARDVVVSAGAEGAVAVPGDEPAYRGRLDRVLTGNATGAGDAMVAALAAGLARGRTWPQMLADGIAWSAAAVLQPLAGEVSSNDIDAMTPQVRIEEIDDTRTP